MNACMYSASSRTRCWASRILGVLSTRPNGEGHPGTPSDRSPVIKLMPEAAHHRIMVAMGSETRFGQHADFTSSPT